MSTKKFLHESVYFNVQVFLHKKACCAFSAYQSFNFLVPVLWKCASLIAAVPVSTPPRISLFLIWHSEGTVELFQDFEKADFPFSQIQHHHLGHRGSREGRKPFSKSIVCKKGGEGGRVMRTGRFCDSLIDLPEPAPSYHFSTTLPQQNSTTVPLWLIHQNQASVIPVLSPYYSTTVSSVQHCPLPNNVIMSRILKTNF